MFIRSSTPIKRNRYIGKLGWAIPVALALGVFVQSVTAMNIPTPHRDIMLSMAAEATPPPEPPAPPPPADPKPTPPDAPNPNAAPPEAPDGVKPEPPKAPPGLPTPKPGDICVNCVPGGTGNKPIFSDPPPLPSPPAPPEPQKPVPVGGKIKEPVKKQHVAPIYPQVALSARVQGIVIIRATIDVHGNVIDAQVTRPVALLNDAALDAVRKWKYEPTLLNGQPVPVIMTVTVNFSLR